MHSRPVIHLLLCFLLAIPGLFSCGDSDRRGGFRFPGRPDSTRIALPDFLGDDGEYTISDVAERSVESVVNVSSTREIQAPGGGFPFDDPLFRRFFGPGAPTQPREQRGVGSGVIVSEDGLVLTNNHVVENADQIIVTTPQGRSFQVEVIGTDPPTDVAVLRLKGDIEGIRPIPIGSSANLRLGEVVLAVGNPFGLDHTVTMGIVSAKGRANVGIVDLEDFIQTDAAINPGNSGGALVNMRGELVGINTAIASGTGGYQGVGFAIPSDMARTVMESILKTGRFERGYLGVNIQTVTQELAESLNIPDGRGVVISGVAEGSPANRAGLRQYDVIMAVDGQDVTTAAELRNIIALRGPGQEVELTIQRDGTERSVLVTLGETPSQQQESPPQAPRGQDGEPSALGLTLRPLDAGARRQYNIPASVNGVVVTGVQPDSRAADIGFRAGDIIMEVNRGAVGSVNEFRSRYRQAGNRVPLLVYRDGGTFLVIISK